MKAWVFEHKGLYYDYMQDGFTAALNNATLYSEESDKEIFKDEPEIQFVPVKVELIN